MDTKVPFLGLKFIFYICVFSLSFCTPKQERITARGKNLTSRKEVIPALQTILDTSGVTGVILMYDPSKDTYYASDFARAEVGHLPASTYKFPHSLIALETGVVEDDRTMFPWDGAARAMPQWEQDLTFQDAFRLSCVPCYQEVARTIGPEQMNAYLGKFHYGTMVVDAATIDQFWLVGESRITPVQQIDFLRRFYDGQLPIGARTQTIVKRMMVMEEEEAYRLSGKTGLSNGEGAYNGWFVGYVETAGGVVFFATNAEPNQSLEVDAFIPLRVAMTKQALRALNLI